MAKKYKNKKGLAGRIKTASIILLLSSLTVLIILSSCSENVRSGLTDNLIRLHVVANSDSPEDQELKNHVRDEIMKYMKDQLKGVKDVDKSNKIINNNLNHIKDIAEDEIKGRGKNYSVDVMLGDYPFPTKVYSDIAFPAGVYKALRVSIGESVGENWWCVLFPPLCFVDATHGTVSEAFKEDFEEIIEKEQYGIFASETSDVKEISVEFKFKAVEVFRNSKEKVGGVVNRIFKASN
ncbi:stage II sporulation protein R [Herbivorax sp. ANBcel31]|uniref:stage II sporulation protein R n=1 Tax=Herbivorax sp. ANBcel31 TaxID=3069754 RepID=UPI0027B4A8F1|nr:stage II sporulation protein R [Herbivorax sp. ANBcel31]MDQ2087516.1 stage II sporulation protein R [Herbivorax sp. ANBcel31]